MSNSISKTGFDAEPYIIHRGWIIDRNPQPRLGRSHIYHHADWTGDNPADARFGYAASQEDARCAIDFRLDPLLIPHGVSFCTVREASDDTGEEWHLECRFEDGAKFAAVKIDYDRPELADFLAHAINGPPTVDLKAVEEIIFHQFYGGPLGGSTRRLGLALQAYLNAILRGHDAPDPTRKEPPAQQD